MKKIFLIILSSVVTVYSQAYIIPLTNAEITTALQNALPLNTTVVKSLVSDTADVLRDEIALKKKYSGSAYSSIDTVTFGGSSLTHFYNRGVVGAEDLALQGKFQIKKGLNILPDSYYGYSNLNFYQGNGTEPSLGYRGMSLVNINHWNGTKQKYETVYQYGTDVAAPLTSDSLPPVYIFLNARDTANVAHDIFGAIGFNYYDPGTMHNRYAGQFMVNSMQLQATFSIATLSYSQPSSLPIFRLHRSAEDSTNKWMTFSNGSGAVNSFEWTDSVAGGVTNSMTWYSRKNGQFAYLSGIGYKFQFSSNNNLLEMQGGGLTFTGGTFTANPNRTDWDNPTSLFNMNNTATTPFDNNFGLKLRNTNNTTNAYAQIYNQNFASVTNASINFVNVDQISKGAITFNTKDTDTQGERVRITEGGHLMLKALESDITASQMTVNDVAIYLKDDKLKIAKLFEGGLMIKELADEDSVFRVADTLGTELLTDKSFESFTGTADDGNSDTWASWGEAVSNGLEEATLTSKFGYAVKMTNNTGGSYVNNSIQQSITVTPETNYRLSFYTRGDGTNSGAYRIYDNTNAANIVANSENNTGISSTTYTQVIDDFTTPSGCTSINIYFYSDGTNGSIVYFDSTSLREIQ